MGEAPTALPELQYHITSLTLLLECKTCDMLLHVYGWHCKSM